MLTKRQDEVLTFLRNTHEATGLMPSTREIQHHFGFASQTAAVDVLRALERKGRLQRLRGKARGIMLTDRQSSQPGSNRMLSIPLYGATAAGYSDPGTQLSGEFLKLDPIVTGIQPTDKCFALRVRGDSMMGAHILDGDFVIVDYGRTPRHRDIVAVLIDGETSLKRIMIEGSRRWLKAENPLFPELIPADSLEVQGVFRGLIRNFESGRDVASSN